MSDCPPPSRYFDPSFGADAAKILPGGFHVTDEDMLLVTVLGSCVAVCLRDSTNGVGGMNHFMLPEGGSGTASASARYGAYAMELLVNEVLKLGARRERLEAKVFGGGAVLADLASLNIGERNAEFALGFLRTEKMAVAAQDLLGPWPRKVYYFPRSGRVAVKTLREMHNDTIVRRERDYRSRLRREPVAGAVELFA
ncbi:MAG TPA: chemoreceptor glutamine deamidase CheD [Burkholderiales bacterium]|nr:chemoreceptor glutamine deamidase CheD [Burkholderiales bacterium]